MVRAQSLKDAAWSAAWICLAALAASGVFIMIERAERSGYAQTSLPGAFLGYEYQLYYVARSSCGACNHEDLPRAVRTVIRHVREDASLVSQSTRIIGVGLDLYPTAGFE